MTHRPNSAVRYPRRARRTRTRSGNDDEHRRLWSGTCGLDWGTWLVPSIAGLYIPTLRVNENRQAPYVILGASPNRTIQILLRVRKGTIESHGAPITSLVLGTCRGIG